MVSNRGLNPPAKTLYWWSILIERFLAYCKKDLWLANALSAPPPFFSLRSTGGEIQKLMATSRRNRRLICSFPSYTTGTGLPTAELFLVHISD